VIDAYVNEVAARLPHKLRGDVALELRSLLTEQLNAAGTAAGRAPDQEMALELVNDLGQPDAVARRYRTETFELIRPEHVPAFFRLVALSVGLQWALTLPMVAHSSFSAWWVSWGLGAFWWVGVLFTVFATMARFPRPAEGAAGSHAPAWRPWTEDIALRPGASWVHFGLCAVLTVFFVSPAWIIGHLLTAGTGGAWAAYDDAFGRFLLPPLIALMIARLILFALVAIRQRSSSLVEDLRLGLWVVFVALLWWAQLRWTFFSNPGVNFGFKCWLAIFLIANTGQIAVCVPRFAARFVPAWIA
jgi:hypothetical protein